MKSAIEVMRALNALAGKHGVGRVDLVENRFVGMKSRGVYETPGGTILFDAHRQMESITMDREVMHLRDSLISRYSTLVYNGFWFAPERRAIQALETELRIIHRERNVGIDGLQKIAEALEFKLSELLRNAEDMVEAEVMDEPA